MVDSWFFIILLGFVQDFSKLLHRAFLWINISDILILILIFILIE